jgi:hypothetical protein
VVGHLLADKITYNSSGDQIIEGTVEDTQATLRAITNEGETKVTYSAQDVAGNVEEKASPSSSTRPNLPSNARLLTTHGTKKNVSISCEVTDDGARFGNDDESVTIELRTDIAEGTTTADAETGSRRVCDKAGNCAAAGPAKGIEVDKENPEITINIPRSGAEYTQSDTVKADYTCTDGGSSIGMCSGQ